MQFARVRVVGEIGETKEPPPKSAVLAAQLFVVYSILSRFLQGNLHYFCRGKANFIVWGAGSYSFKTGCWLGTILILFEHMPYVITYILGYPTGYSQHNTPNKCGVLSVEIKTVSEDILPDPSPLTFRPHQHADDPRQNDAAWRDFAGPSQGADGRCSTQGAAEY